MTKISCEPIRKNDLEWIDLIVMKMGRRGLPGDKHDSCASVAVSFWELTRKTKRPKTSPFDAESISLTETVPDCGSSTNRSPSPALKPICKNEHVEFGWTKEYVRAIVFNLREGVGRIDIRPIHVKIIINNKTVDPVCCQHGLKCVLKNKQSHKTVLLQE